MAGSISAEALDQTWHHLSKQKTAEHLHSDPDAGLTAGEVSQRQEEFGPNQLTPDTGTSPWIRFLQQFNQPLHPDDATDSARFPVAFVPLTTAGVGSTVAA